MSNNPPPPRQKPLKSSTSFPKQYPHTNNHTNSQIIYQSTFDTSESNIQFMSSMEIESRIKEFRRKFIEDEKKMIQKLNSPNFQVYRPKDTSFFINKKGQSDSQQYSNWKSIQSQPIKKQIDQPRNDQKKKKIKSMNKMIIPPHISSQIMCFLPEKYQSWVSEIPEDQLADLYQEIMKEKKFYDYKQEKFAEIQKQKGGNVSPEYKLPDERKQIYPIINLLSSQSQASQEIVYNRKKRDNYKRNLNPQPKKNQLSGQKKRGEINPNLMNIIKQFKVMVSPLQPDDKDKI